LSEKEVKRFDLVKTFLERINFRVSQDRNYQTKFKSYEYVRTEQSSFMSCLGSHSITLRVPNFEREIIRPKGVKSFNIWSGAGLAIIPIAYVCVHLAAWNATFPTRIEKLLWSSSCFYLTGCGIGFAMRVAWSQINYIALKGASPILERMKLLEITILWFQTTN
jgi:hypothetical protein